MGFPTGVAHNLHNPHDRALVYLVGGESREVEIAEFPQHGKRAIRWQDRFEIYDLAEAQPFRPLEDNEE